MKPRVVQLIEILLLLAIEFPIFCASSEHLESSNSSCLTYFNSNREHFEPCTENVCFLFIERSPYAILDPVMRTEDHQRLFPCRNKHKLFRQLEGVNFLLSQATVIDALCVWAGPCTEDELIKFLIERGRDPTTKKYWFGAQGMIAQLPERMSSDLQSTQTILDAPIVLVKSLSKGSENNFMKSVRSVFLGFDSNTWIMIAGFIIGLLFIAFLVTYAFTGSVRPIHVLLHILGEPIKMKKERKRLGSQANYSVVIALLCGAFSIFAFLTILFYEISVVNFLNVSKETSWNKLTEWSHAELHTFCMEESSGAERAFLAAVDPNEKRFKSGYPWVRTKDKDSCFKKLMDPNSRISIIVEHQPEAIYGIRRFKICEKVAQLVTENYLMASWFVTTTVPPHIVQNLDREILQTKISGLLKQIIDDETGQSEEGCSREVLSIGPYVIGVPLFILLVPIAILEICFIFAECFGEKKSIP